MRSRRVVLLVGLSPVLLVLGLAVGCSKGSSGPGVASAAGGARATGTAHPSASADRQTQLLHYAQCMRQHGVNVPDPDPNGTAKIVLPSGGTKDSRTVAAMSACGSLLPNGGAPSSWSPQQIEQLRRYAQCMRDHGIQVSDPDPNDGSIAIGGAPPAGGAAEGPDGTPAPGGSPGTGPRVDKTRILSDPAFQAAEHACRNELPNGKGGGK